MQTRAIQLGIYCSAFILLLIWLVHFNGGDISALVIAQTIVSLMLVALVVPRKNALCTNFVQETTSSSEAPSITYDSCNDFVSPEYLGMLAHEIRNPLTAILGFANELLVAPRLSSSEIMDHASCIIKTAEEIDAIIADTLSAAVLTSGEYKSNFKTVDLYADIESTIINVSQLYPQRELYCYLIYDAPALVELDVYALHRVVGNLIANAFNYTHTGGIIVRASLLAGDMMTISVTDTGVGIPANEIGNIFCLFNRGEGRGRGHGLGLNVVKLYMNHINSSATALRVESVENEGSKFTIEFPVKIASSVSPQQRNVMSLDWPREMNIAVLDDSDLFYEHVENRLTHYAQIDISRITASYDGPRIDVLIVRKAKRYGAWPGDPLHVISFESEACDEQAVEMLKTSCFVDDVVCGPILTSKLVQLIYLATFKLTMMSKQEERQFSNSILTIEDTHALLNSAEPPLAGIRILNVDDQLSNLKLNRTLLSSLGAHVVDASSGHAAIQFAEQESYDLILLDLMMPVLTGEETAETLRKSTLNAKTPIIGLTATHDLSKFPRFLALTDAVFQKPFSRDTIINAIFVLQGEGRISLNR